MAFQNIQIPVLCTELSLPAACKWAGKHDQTRFRHTLRWIEGEKSERLSANPSSCLRLSLSLSLSLALTTGAAVGLHSGGEDPIRLLGGAIRSCAAINAARCIFNERFDARLGGCLQCSCFWGYLLGS